MMSSIAYLGLQTGLPGAAEALLLLDNVAGDRGTVVALGTLPLQADAGLVPVNDVRCARLGRNI